MAKQPAFWPLDDIFVTGAWANSPKFYAQFNQKGHPGIDLGAKNGMAVGTPIYACDDGVVEFAGWGGNHSWMSDIAGYCVLVKHWWGYSEYNHMYKTPFVKKGQKVTPATHLGGAGATGAATGVHLHFGTLPLKPNFSNGFAGRVNPKTLLSLQQRSKLIGKVIMKSYTPKATNNHNQRQVIPVGDVYRTLYISDENLAGKRSVSLASGAKDITAFVDVNIAGPVGATGELAFIVSTYKGDKKVKDSRILTIDIPAIPAGDTMVKAQIGYNIALDKDERLRVALRADKSPLSVARVGWSIR